MNSTAYSHAGMRDNWLRDSKARNRHAETDRAATAVDIYGTPRRVYRPVMGVSGTLQHTPNPCMERDRDELVGPHLSASSSGDRKSGAIDRSAEVDLNWGFPAHQVHHHHFGWTQAGSNPMATVYSPRRPWGIGLQYADRIAPFTRRIAEMPQFHQASSSPRERGGGNRSSWAEGGQRVVAGSDKSFQTSLAQLSTAAPSDATLTCGSETWTKWDS